MKTKFFLAIFCIILCLSACQKEEPASLLAKANTKSIAFLGGTLISEMENHGYFESALSLYFPGQEIQVRNIGWPADDVFGLARSQFGSAQNTQSWQPPTAEEGYGSKVLIEHIEAVKPTTLLLGYGSEGAYFEEEEDFDLFKSGYLKLLDLLEEKGIQLLLVSPPKQEIGFYDSADTDSRNEWLARVSDFIKTTAEKSGHIYIDLYDQLITDPSQKQYTYNGVQLNKKGYQKMVALLSTGLGMSVDEQTLDKEKHNKLLTLIREKNRLYRFILRPLNEAYIYLFRRHEMGHLASEMDDLRALISEKEKEIQALAAGRNYDPPEKEEKPWQAPQTYEEHEVPTVIPPPDIAVEKAAFNIAEGYEIGLFAADPMIANPININWDTKGRAWVATSSTYPHIVPGREPNDKIIILEDTDGDGKADKHTVFAENLLVPHSVMPVPGGAYVLATTELLFLADTDGDDIADEKRVVFDGFGNADVHHTIHGFRWTPWGDLHFTQSIYINSFVETPHGKRVLNGSGTWSFRPETEGLEIFSRGLVNPWGEAFDQWGQAFATDGAGGSGINYIFPESAHATAVGAPDVLRGLNEGTPKNAGAEVIYSRHFPNDWQGSIITNDYRANRTVRYALKPFKSGYTSKEVETVLHSDHRSYRPVDNKIGPDGALYIVDWYNPIIAHGEVDFHHPARDRAHGRIWKLTAKNQPLLKEINYAATSFSDLLDLLKSPEQFTRLQANRAFVERKGDPKLVVDWINDLDKRNKNYAQHRLEGLWLLTARNFYEDKILKASLKSSNPRERAAALRVISHWKKQEAYQSDLTALIRDRNPQVRLEALHTLREWGTRQAAEIAMQVRQLEMDENLSFALNLSLSKLQEQWLTAFSQGENPFGGSKNDQLYALLNSEDSRVVAPLDELISEPSVDKELARRAWFVLAKIGSPRYLEKVLQKATKERDLGLLQALAGAPASNHAKPSDLAPLRSLISDENAAMRKTAMQIAGRWQAIDFAPVILEQLRKSTDKTEQIVAMQVLQQLGQQAEIRKMALSVKDQNIQGIATLVWAQNDPEEAVSRTVDLLAVLENPDLAESIFSTFIRTDAGPDLLIEALDGKTIPEPIASAGLKVVQSSGLPLAALDQAIRTAGNIQAIGMELSPEDKEQLLKDALSEGSTRRGYPLFRQKELQCMTCHRVNNIGGLAGPDLSAIGTFMTPAAILDAIIHPNNDIKQGFETVVLTKNNGDIISGLLERKTDKSTLIRLANSEIMEVPAAEIAKIDVSPMSLMPAGLTRNLTRDELRDLLAYLMSLGVEQ